MSRLQELKEQILEETSERPEKFFAVEKIRESGFRRGKCEKCGKYFWSTDESRGICGDPSCTGGYGFIDDSPTEETYSYAGILKKFKEFMSERGYRPIGRYPVVARWRNDTEFVRASIYDFQPYVVSGEVEPPAKELVIPQPSLRFNDIDNVGITGRHYILHNHIGQHAFRKRGEFDQGKYFKDMLEWLIEGIGIPKEKIVLHEDVWGGGGNLGPCMEFFVDGLELLNQVYMSYEIDNSKKGYSELDMKVLDMGMGHERITWITHGTETSYQSVMPEVIEKLQRKTELEPDRSVWKEFLPYSGILNVDELTDVEKAWSKIAEEMDMEKSKLKDEIETLAALYSIADHTRALLFAFVDGAFPSNTGEKHSLRVVARRALDFIDKYGWDIDLKEVMAWHAEELVDVFPELKEGLGEAKEIMAHEERKYEKMKVEAKKITEGLKDKDINEGKLIELYDSKGISPEMLKRLGFDVETPNNFYAKVAERHGQEEGKEEEKMEFDLDELPKTEFLFRKDERKEDFKAEVLKIEEGDGKNFVVLDKTCFYPESGGQIYDKGNINGKRVSKTIKRNGVILHVMDEVNFKEGEEVKGSIKWDRRKQLMQHHSAAHLINGAAREVLGNHVWQAGAKKTTEKARLDITHYDTLSREKTAEIQRKANDWAKEGLEVKKLVMKRNEAEKKYGFRIYQGGVPPGNNLRILVIGAGIDVEACGGTHVDNTSEIEDIIITSSSKVQDGVIRIEFKAGEAAREYRKGREEIKKELNKWIDLEDYELGGVAEIYDVDVEKLPEVVERFVEEWEEREKRAGKLKEDLGRETEVKKRSEDPEELFEEWKEKEKSIRELEKELASNLKEKILDSDKDFYKEKVDIENTGILIRLVKDIISNVEEKSVVIIGNNSVVASRGEKSDRDLEDEVKKEAEVVKTSGDLIKGFNLKD